MVTDRVRRFSLSKFVVGAFSADDITSRRRRLCSFEIAGCSAALVFRVSLHVIRLSHHMHMHMHMCMHMSHVVCRPTGALSQRRLLYKRRVRKVHCDKETRPKRDHFSMSRTELRAQAAVYV